uniref:Putative secreted protein n=1 Tax=Anopheles darlingi TaxID=43151 RepID=A0A2M4DNJ5_ANODA
MLTVLSISCSIRFVWFARSATSQRFFCRRVCSSPVTFSASLSNRPVSCSRRSAIVFSRSWAPLPPMIPEPAEVFCSRPNRFCISLSVLFSCF